MVRWFAGVALAVGTPMIAGGCGNGGDPEPLFPDDYAASYQEVRDCRSSTEHGLIYVRVLADQAALAPYRDRMAPFPDGAVVLKEEYDDPDCAGPVAQWTVMAKEADGSDPDNLDWRWQTVDRDRTVIGENAPRCAACHATCGEPPKGYGGTCTVEDPGG